MKLKLDENLGRSIATQLRAADHDVHTIADEQLLGTDDAKVLAVATSEGRVLVTNDLDFSDPRRTDHRTTPASWSYGSVVRHRLSTRPRSIRSSSN